MISTMLSSRACGVPPPAMTSRSRRSISRGPPPRSTLREAARPGMASGIRLGVEAEGGVQGTHGEFRVVGGAKHADLDLRGRDDLDVEDRKSTRMNSSH